MGPDQKQHRQRSIRKQQPPLLKDHYRLMVIPLFPIQGLAHRRVPLERLRNLGPLRHLKNQFRQIPLEHPVRKHVRMDLRDCWRMPCLHLSGHVEFFVHTGIDTKQPLIEENELWQR